MPSAVKDGRILLTLNVSDGRYSSTCPANRRKRSISNSANLTRYDTQLGRLGPAHPAGRATSRSHDRPLRSWQRYRGARQGRAGGIDVLVSRRADHFTWNGAA